jgi:hypothetical protein
MESQQLMELLLDMKARLDENSKTMNEKMATKEDRKLTKKK